MTCDTCNQDTAFLITFNHRKVIMCKNRECSTFGGFYYPDEDNRTYRFTCPICAARFEYLPMDFDYECGEIELDCPACDTHFLTKISKAQEEAKRKLERIK